MSKQHRKSAAILVCENQECRKRYHALPGLRLCGACGGKLKAVEKKHLPPKEQR